MHVAHVAAPDEAENVPLRQLAHDELELGLYCPGVHTEQLLPTGDELFLPAWHVSHLVPVLY